MRRPSDLREKLALLILLAACKPSPAPSPFRFSPRPNRAHEIKWRTWEPSVFRAGKPILLSLSAVWCHWCHVLDETSLSDSRVIERLNRDFVPVRVDADQHPDLERRYILGGWPTVAVLTARGEIVAGGTYVAPDALVQLLDGAREAVQAGGAVLERMTGRYRRHFDPHAQGEIDSTIVEEVTRTLARAADLEHGGLGRAPKFPHGAAIELLLAIGERELAKKALDGMLALEDPVEHGFYRYATRPDWTVPHYEKMLAGNAELLSAYARGFSVLHDVRYREAALRIVSYVRHTLYDEKSGALWASQDADEDYSQLDAAGRAQRKPPYVDRTLITDRAARMIAALRSAARDLQDPTLEKFAQDAAKAIFARGIDWHAPGVRAQLADYAWLALAQPDERIFAAAQQRLASPRGGFFDCEARDEGLLRERERPLVDNAILARAFLRAGKRKEAEATLRAFAGSYLLQGIEAAEYALAVNEFLATK